MCLDLHFGKYTLPIYRSRQKIKDVQDAAAVKEGSHRHISEPLEPMQCMLFVKQPIVKYPLSTKVLGAVDDKTKLSALGLITILEKNQTPRPVSVTKSCFPFNDGHL